MLSKWQSSILLPVLGLVLLGFANPAHAQLFTPISDFSDAALVLVRNLEQQGVQSLGPLSLPQVEKDIRQVSAKGFSFGFAAATDTARSTASCYPKEHLVIISMLSWNQMNPDDRPLMALHEGLCAAGYVDDDYQLSSAIWEAGFELALHKPIQNLIQKVERTTTNPAFIQDYRGGGVTAVGGGGDSDGIDFKRNLFIFSDVFYSRKAQSISLQDFNQLIMDSQIEINRADGAENETFVIVKPDANGHPYFLIPSTVLTDANLKAKAISDVYEELLSRSSAGRTTEKRILIPGIVVQ